MEELTEWLNQEPDYRRCEIRFLGDAEDYSGPGSHRPRWEVKVWSQYAGGTPRKTPGVGVGDTMQWAVFRAMTAYFEVPRE